MTAALAGTRQISAVAFIDQAGDVVRAFRSWAPGRSRFSRWKDDVGTARVLEEQRFLTRINWGGLFFAESNCFARGAAHLFYHLPHPLLFRVAHIQPEHVGASPEQAGDAIPAVARRAEGHDNLGLPHFAG